jgi:hypothetical protein
MIRFAVPVHPEKGYGIDVVMPVVVCDVCDEVINVDQGGNVFWDGDGTTEMWHVHRSMCTWKFTQRQSRGQMSRSLGEWLGQLRYNYEHPVIGSEIRLPAGDGKVRVRELRLQ